MRTYNRLGFRLGQVMLAATLPGLAAAQQASESDTVRDSGDSVLQEIIVTADRPKSFAADLMQAGTFRGAALIDTPLTVNVLTRELLDSQQVTQLYDALRNTAGVTSAQLNNALYSNMAIRGIVVENRGNYRLNGAPPVINLIDLPIENKERVEVLKGVSALYYGFTTPSGIVNLTSKRPPAERVLDATVFANRFGTVGGHVDYGEQFADGAFGVRVNALYSDLDIGLDHTSGDRSFASVAADWRPTDTLKFELDLERIDKTYSEPTTYFVATPAGGAAPVLPPLPDPEKNLGGDWMQGKGYENNVLLTGPLARGQGLGDQLCSEYIAPLMGGQVDASLMTAYTMYVERTAEGDRNAVLVKAYRDAATFERVAAFKLELRTRLAAHPTYPKWHPIKDTLRDNVSETLAVTARGQ